jgi:hypothetical protein
MKSLLTLAVLAAALTPALAPNLALAQVSTITDKPASYNTDGKRTVAADGRICKTLVITGSRLPTKKVCKTEAEWAAQTAATKDQLDELARRNGAVNKIAGAEGG